MQANIRLEHQLLAVEIEQDVHAMLELVAPERAADAERAPLQLAVVIDRSGSMSGEKLEVAKRCAAYLVRRLAPEDQLALVSFDDDVDLVAALAPVDGTALEAAIGGVYPGGSTNLSGGWLKGREELGRAPDGAARRLLLLTDGQANVGVVDPATLSRMASKARAEGIGTTTIGFGDGFDEELLTAMADAGGGRAHYAETPDRAPAIFAQEFEGLTSLMAQNVSAEIRPSDEVEFVGVLNEYPTTAVPGGVQLQLGDAFGGERRRVTFRLHVPSLASLGVVKVADVVVRYVTVGDEVAAHELTIPVTVNLVSADDASAAPADREVTEEVVVLEAAKAEAEARELANTGDFDGAQRVLKRTAQHLRTVAPGSAHPDQLLKHAESMEGMTGLMDRHTYSAAQSKRMHYRVQHMRRVGPVPDDDPTAPPEED